MNLYSHPRSGTNYLVTMLEEAFRGTRTFGSRQTGHWSERYVVQASVSGIWKLHPFYTDSLPKPRIYIYRDGRDVALSTWRTKGFQHESWRELSFAEFLRKPLDWYGTPGNKSDKNLTIVEHWKKHLDSWVCQEVCYVQYEELLLNPEVVLERIARYIEKPLLEVPVIGDVGPEPSGDYRVQKWRDVFTPSDLEYFFSIVPEDYWGLDEG